jgi:hypothetical protein
MPDFDYKSCPAVYTDQDSRRICAAANKLNVGATFKLESP